MPVRYQPLTPRQLAVLRWIAEGCPDGTWPDDSHKISARALETRNLATVSRRGGQWHATIKPDGAYYLAHGHYPNDPPSAPDPSQPPQSVPRNPDEIDVDDLITRLQAGGPIQVEPPTPRVRAAYRRAISAAITGGKVPTGLTLRHTGRDHGDLVISLVEPHPVTSKPAPIPIPNTHNPEQPAIRHLLENGSGWAVSPDARPRALTLIQALADEAARRGHHLGKPHAETSTFRVDIGEDSFAFLLTEEHDKGERVPQEQLEAAKYSWQRVRPQAAMIPSGRLTLQLQHGRRHPHWADRRRWRLDEKLATVIELIEEHAAEARRQREDAAAERARRRQLWEQAVPQARARYVYDRNAERFLAQARASAQVADVLAYCQRLADRAADEPDMATRRLIEEWASWGRTHADATDPLSRVEELRHVEPAEAKADDLDRYMPRGMTVRHPPEQGP